MAYRTYTGAQVFDAEKRSGIVQAYSFGSASVMQFFNCFDPACGRPFQVNEFSNRIMPGGDFANIVCPHCGASYEGDPSAIFLTHALSPQQEEALRQDS